MADDVVHPATLPDQEVTPDQASGILGLARPLVVHRMDVGDLPFRTVGGDRRARLGDVLALKKRLDAQRASTDALVEDTEDLNPHPWPIGRHCAS